MVVSCLFVAAVFRPRIGAAQTFVPEPPSRVEFMSRTDIGMSAEALTSDDPRFRWIARWGGDLDLVDYVAGRLTFLAEYQTILGNELQPFDPNQGNYTLAASASVRAGGTEFLGVFHHVSRHLGDRSKDFGIAWNVLNVRVLRRFSVGDTTVDVRGEAGPVLARAYVDYTWVALADVTLRRQVSPRVRVYGLANWQAYGVDEELAGRQRQLGGRVEAGAHLGGTGGGLELYGGFERMIDADPIVRGSRDWAFAGFRLTAH
jgi:hypothetical protein